MRNQGQGHIRQRGKQSWELKFDLGRDPATGQRISRHVTFRGTKREAQAELNRLLNRRNEGTYVDPTKMSVAEYLEHWLTVDIERRVARKTAVRHRGIVQHNIVPHIGAMPLRKLTAVHIEALEAALQRQGRQRHRDSRGAALSAQTVLHVHRTLSQALEHAVKTEVLFRNPALQVRPPRPPGREIKILTKPEIARRPPARSAPQLRVTGHRSWCQPADDRQAFRAPPGNDDTKIRTPGARRCGYGERRAWWRNAGGN